MTIVAEIRSHPSKWGGRVSINPFCQSELVEESHLLALFMGYFATLSMTY